MAIKLIKIENVNGSSIAIFDNGARVLCHPGPGGLFYPTSHSLTEEPIDDTPPIDVPDPEEPTEPGEGYSFFKWPMNPQAINSRNDNLSGAYGADFGGPNTIRRDHNGLDFSWPPTFTAGMPILSIADGVVSKAYWEPGGGGWAVEVKHTSRWYSGYYHAVPSSLKVAAGQPVKQGDHLMNAGESGNVTGPVLHFMVVDMAKTGRYWSSHMNPETFMAEHNPNDYYV